MQTFDVIIIGAGAAGLMCAQQAGQRQRSVLVLDHAKKPGRKILISGGGRCNFTNLDISAEHYICRNPHFVKSALAQYSQWDFIHWVEQQQIAYEERSHGQLFCQQQAKDILDMLLQACAAVAVEFRYRCNITQVTATDQGFSVQDEKNQYQCHSLVIATGGLSMPKLGATPFGYQLAEQFGLACVPTQAALVPFTLSDTDKTNFAALAGVATPVTINTASGPSFRESLLFTHRGLSGPAVLQASSYWQAGETITIDFLDGTDLATEITQAQQQQCKQQLHNFLSQFLPKRLSETLLHILVEQGHLQAAVPQKAINQLTHKQIDTLTQALQQWQIKPQGTEGYRTAEVTSGGIDTDAFSSKTMQSKQYPGLFCIGEVLDVAGWLGGYNFQWAWSSGYVAGLHV